MQMKLSLFNWSIMFDSSAAFLLVTCASFSIIWWRILDWASARRHTAEDKNKTYWLSIVYSLQPICIHQQCQNPLDCLRTSLWNAIERQKSVRRIWSALARWAPHPPGMPMLSWTQVVRRRFKADRNQLVTKGNPVLRILNSFLTRRIMWLWSCGKSGWILSSCDVHISTYFKIVVNKYIHIICV